MKKALITGINGQDGSYLSELLVDKGYKVWGTVKRNSVAENQTARINDSIFKKINLEYADLNDLSSLLRVIKLSNPTEIYNLAAQSHVAVSFKNPIYSTYTSTVGPITILDSIRNIEKDIKFYQASSSEMFGGTEKIVLNEESLFEPKSPYAAAKVFAHHMTSIYRDSYSLFCSNGILFNHESPHRGETFVTRKITRAATRIKLGLQNKLTLGNLEASRDWGFAGDYVEAMWMMLQHDTPDDWVIATGETYTVRQFLEATFKKLDLNWEEYVQTSDKYLRPNEVEHLLGDPTKAKEELGWEPKTSFDSLVEMMIESDLNLAKREKVLVAERLLEPTWENPTS